MDQNIIRNKIKECRLQNNFTQLKLSEIAGFKYKKAISDIENGKRKVSMEELKIFSNIFGKDVDFFLKNTCFEQKNIKFNWKINFS